MATLCTVHGLPLAERLELVGDAGNCVELRNDLTALRDSKRPETPLPVDRTALTRLVSFARSR